MKEELVTNESIKKLCDEYLIPGCKVEYNRVMQDHLARFHSDDSQGLALSIAGVEIKIKAKK